MRLRHALNTLVLACAGLAMLGGATAARADGYPERPVKWIVPFPPGGAMDSIARTLGESMGKQLNTSFIVENRAGAGGNIGAASVARAKPDGYTILIVANGMAVNPALYADLNYDPIKDFAPISLLAVVPNVLVTNPARTGANSVQDVIAKAKAQPNHYTYASAGVGTSIHLAGELFLSMANVEMLHVPYKGSGPAIADLLGGQVDYMFDSITSAKPHIEAGKLRALGVTTRKRSAALPDVPTIAESGLPGYELMPWFAAFAPAGTPPEVVTKLNAAMRQALADPKVRATLDSIGAESIGGSPEELRDHLGRETAQWKTLVKERGIKIN
ncbi:tripartite tricarboxylate transporter substrate binding protein [Achromobacter denitrificans]|jgi:tripartite-type tricarboxylate transporter receptor subunit TctC|uniref:Tripartite tricarboxylate transporter substrate binding protein n=1 Tax=Achromobacter denitrificans TaxID=32002 RepID=A0A427WJI1_ACHDE|nr:MULTISPECIES: tripartite tricarboxylate transporter substrate binding protein [Achromobacter]MBV2162368.1 tripartite tricarboxylate transporter substrate binding protein [Achromobacter denitrificans]MDF3849099.1 tripartite tricarboxylate transporter substrate binding protein [Achromobacter denitrificans]MDF3857997.1 tripartite tricarboxylate transporter substrate binding protein [Achromobacter denitrificans]MDF3940446.1 tripartite tricarboxylate transporter substrate binding protein [Achromo